MDVHLRSTSAEVVDPSTGECRRLVVRTTREALGGWLGKEAPMRVVLEASTGSHWVADLVEQLGHQVVVVDPGRTSAVAVAGGRKKTDRLDAAALAWLSTKDALVPSHRSSAPMRERRRRLVLRQRMVRSRGDLVRAVRSVFAAEGMVIRGGRQRGFAAAVRAQAGTELQPLVGILRSIEVLEEQVAVANRELHSEAIGDPIVRRLMTVDGVGPVVATAYRVVLEDVGRFRSGREVGAYVGLVPSVHNSGDAKNRLGRISKRGDKMLRSLLVEAGHTVLRCRQPSDLRAWGQKLMARVGRKKAAVALARKMCVLLWAMWKKSTDFRRWTPASS